MQDTTDTHIDHKETAEGPETAEDIWRWLDQLGLCTYRVMYQREKGDIPAEKILFHMETPLRNLQGASWLLRDLAYGALTDTRPKAVGLYFLGQAVAREVDILYRLYHGESHQTCELD